jgi:ribonuclease HII
MVIAGVWIDKEDESKLKELNVRDSKLVSPKKREFLAKKIKKIAKKVEIVLISAKEIDESRKRMSLNKIELNAFVEIINKMDASEVYVDLPENGKKFGFILKQKMKNWNSKLVAEHKADVKYVVVGAASIIAKVERDRQMRELEKETGLELSSGYPADPHVVNFLKKWLEDHEEFPDFVRKSWITAHRLVGKKKQKALSAFLKKQKKLREFED